MHISLAPGLPTLIDLSTVPSVGPVEIRNFRTLPNGTYRWMRGLRRGYWRTLRVWDPAGPLTVNSHNVVSQRRESPNGILGVTPRSAYYIGE